MTDICNPFQNPIENDAYKENERFTFEIDTENALLYSTWNAETTTSSAFQFSTLVVADFRRLKMGNFCVAGVCHSREKLKIAVVSGIRCAKCSVGRGAENSS